MVKSKERIQLEQEEQRLTQKLEACRLLERTLAAPEGHCGKEQAAPHLPLAERMRTKRREQIDQQELARRKARRIDRLYVIIPTVLLVAIAAFYTCFLTIRDFRVAVWSTLDPIFNPGLNDVTEIMPRRQTKTPVGWSGLYYPSYIPEEYYLLQQQRQPNGSFHRLEFGVPSQNSDVTLPVAEMTFIQMNYSEGLRSDNEDGVEKFFEIPGYLTTRLFLKRNQYNLMMTDGKLTFIIYAPASVGEEEMLKIARGIRLYG